MPYPYPPTYAPRSPYAQVPSEIFGRPFTTVDETLPIAAVEPFWPEVTRLALGIGLAGMLVTLFGYGMEFLVIPWAQDVTSNKRKRK